MNGVILPSPGSKGWRAEWTDGRSTAWLVSPFMADAVRWLLTMESD